MFVEIYSNQSERFMRKIDLFVFGRLDKKIEGLKLEPYPTDCKRVVNSDYGNKVFRVRVGNLRILYEVFVDENKIMIHRIEKRSQVYLKEELKEYNKIN